MSNASNPIQPGQPVQHSAVKESTPNKFEPFMEYAKLSSKERKSFNAQAQGPESPAGMALIARHVLVRSNS